MTALMVPLVAMSPAWAGRGRMHCCRTVCEIACEPVVVCPPVACVPVACACDPCSETVAVENAAASGEPVPDAESVVAKPVAPPAHEPTPVPEPVPPLRPADVAPASAEQPAPPPPSESRAKEPEMKEPATPEETPEPKPEPTPEPPAPAEKPAPAPEPEPTPPPLPPEPQPPATLAPPPKPAPPAEDNIFEEEKAGADAKPGDDEPMDDEKAPKTDDEKKPADEDDPFAAAPSAVEPVRRWIDDTGSHDAVGRLVEVHPDRVRILKMNGAFTTVPIDRLSPADRHYVTTTGERLAVKPRVIDTAGM